MGEGTNNGNQGVTVGLDKPQPLIVPKPNGWANEPGFVAPTDGPIVRRKVRRFTPTVGDAETETETRSGNRTEKGNRTSIPAEMGIPVAYAAEEIAEAVTRRQPPRTAKKEIAKKQVTMMLDVVNNVAQGAIGPNAGMRVYEREMIETPAHVYAETHTKEVQWAAEKFAPLTIALGVSLWLKRAMREAGVSVPNPLRPRPKQTRPPLMAVVPLESQRSETPSVVPVEQPDMPEPPRVTGNNRTVSADEIYQMTAIGGR